MTQPRDEAQLAEAIAGATGALSIRGGGTRRAPVLGEVLDVSALSGVSVYEPGAMTLVAGAGTPIAEIEAVLAGENQRLAFEPMDHRALMGREGTPTLGGMVAANVSGPRRIAVGACRDHLLGLRFVDGMGRVVKNGGRVMKNVTGYDLVRLVAGSHGTLGVISEVSIKVMPRPETMATLRLEGLEDGAAIEALSVALGSPFDVTGAAHFPGGATLIRIEGFEASVAYRAEALRADLARFGDVEISADEAVWVELRNVCAFADQAGDVWRFSVLPSDGPALGAQVRAAGGEAIYDWGGGLVWALLPEGADGRALLAAAGHATRMRGAGAAPDFHPEPAPLARLSAGLRAKFDPRGILNPGLMAPASSRGAA